MGLFYLVRHGETDWNKNGLCMGQLDIPLNAIGIKQAERLAARLCKIKVDAIYASDLSRAAQTAQIIATMIQRKPVFLKELREIYLGAYQGLSSEGVRDKFPSAYLIPSGSLAQQNELNEPEIENRTKLYHRVVPIFEKMLKDHQHERVTVVTHGGVMRCLMNYVLGRSSNHNESIFYSTAVDCSNCSITLVRIEPDGRPKLVGINDTAHLDLLLDESIDARDFG